MEMTFEQLIEEGLSKIDDFDDVPVLMAKLMQQVREATIAECHVIADKYYFQNSKNIIRDINELPTYRIKIDRVQ